MIESVSFQVESVASKDALKRGQPKMVALVLRIAWKLYAGTESKYDLSEAIIICLTTVVF